MRVSNASGPAGCRGLELVHQSVECHVWRIIDAFAFVSESV
jgi:hypothetical protein